MVPLHILVILPLGNPNPTPTLTIQLATGQHFYLLYYGGRGATLQE